MKGLILLLVCLLHNSLTCGGCSVCNLSDPQSDDKPIDISELLKSFEVIPKHHIIFYILLQIIIGQL